MSEPTHDVAHSGATQQLFSHFPQHLKHTSVHQELSDCLVPTVQGLQARQHFSSTVTHREAELYTETAGNKQIHYQRNRN